MMELDYNLLLCVSAATIIIGALLHRMTQGPERLFLYGFLGGIYVLCGFGSAYDGVPHSYALKYIVYVMAAGATFTIVTRASRAYGARRCREIDARLRRVTFRRICVVGFWLYILAMVFPLIYPTLRLEALWNPPNPDLSASFGHGITPEQEIGQRLIGYLTVLFLPVYLWRLRAYATSKARLALAVFGPLYLTYCADSYLGRGTMLVGMTLYTILMWRYNPRARKYLVLALLFVGPLVLSGFSVYERLRQGKSAIGGATTFDEISTLIVTETRLPINAAVVLESGMRVSLGDLALWVITLPMPKVLTGRFGTFQPNFDMAEMILNRGVGSREFFVALPGIVGESVYFVGPWFYWLHGVLTGGLVGLLCGAYSRSSELFGLTVYCAVSWGYIFSRAGLPAGLPPLLNGILPFLAIVVFLTRRGVTDRVRGYVLPLNARSRVPAHDDPQEGGKRPPGCGIPDTG